MQGPIRVASQASGSALYVEADTLQRRRKLGGSPVSHGNPACLAPLTTFNPLVLVSVLVYVC